MSTFIICKYYRHGKKLDITNRCRQLFSASVVRCMQAAGAAPEPQHVGARQPASDGGVRHAPPATLPLERRDGVERHRAARRRLPGAASARRQRQPGARRRRRRRGRRVRSPRAAERERHGDQRVGGAGAVPSLPTSHRTARQRHPATAGRLAARRDLWFVKNIYC